LRLALIEGSRASDNERASDTPDGAGVVYIDLSNARFERCVVHVSKCADLDARRMSDVIGGE